MIPARFASGRFPGKMIADLAGKPLVVHAYERAVEATRVAQAVVATDDVCIAEALRPFDIPVVMTRPDHACGTDRIAEVARTARADVIVNVQGDEPLLEPAAIDAAVEALLADDGANVATVRTRITDAADVTNPNVVKVVCDGAGRALYFSRSPIPYVRDAGGVSLEAGCYWQHLGLYVYRREFLLRFTQMEQTPLEQLEKLEQLRVLEHGGVIVVVDTDYKSVGVDTPEDLERVRVLLKQRKEGTDHA